MHQPPSFFPIFDPDTEILRDGADIPASQFCRNALKEKSECRSHYDSLARRAEGFYQCPFGLTSRSFRFLGKLWILTGVVAHPRFGTPGEREMAKRYKEVRVSRDAMEAQIKFFRQLELS